MWWVWRCRAPALLVALAATLLPAAPLAQRPAPCAHNALCYCHEDHFTCNHVPFHRFPDTDVGVWHVSVVAARLGTLAEAALDGRRLRTLVLVASNLHHIEPGALSSMVSTLASLDLGHNEFSDIPLRSLRNLKVLNWLNLQNNYISDLDASMDWGFLVDSLTSLSLSNNNLCNLSEGSLTALRRLAQLDLDGNRLHVLASGALPPVLAVLRLADNSLRQLPCAALADLPHLRHLHMRNNALHPLHNRTCPAGHSRLDSLDISHNELDDTFHLELAHRQLRQLVLDFNSFTSLPTFVTDNGRLQKISAAYNSITHVSDATMHALRHSLERLELDYNELETLPPSLREMTHLRYLSVAYNRLTDVLVLPPRLQSLSFAGNFLTQFPAGLRDMTAGALAYLDLSYNQLTVVNVKVFGAWSNELKTLNLKANRITQFANDAFPTTLPLRELAISFNEFYLVTAEALSTLRDLQVLELSSALLSGEFPIATPLEALSWLTIDNNNIHYVTADDIFKFPSLEYLNLDFNKIVEFPSELSGISSTCKLKELRLSYNYISRINNDFLLELKQLQSVDLSYNRLHNLSENTIASLPNLVYLDLAGNGLQHIAERAFCDLPKLEVLELQNNYLTEFASEYFQNVSNDIIYLSVNASYNRISSLVDAAAETVVLMNVLDLSHNLLETLSKGFLHSLRTSLTQLVLSSNRLTHIDNLIFNELPKLEVLCLRDNSISAMKRRAFAELSALQMLDLSRNRLSQLSVEQFHNMRRLRHLRLDENFLRSLPRDCFKNTVLEHLDLTHNQLLIFPSSSLAQVGFTLRHLGLAHNRLEYLDSAMFHAISFLHELNLAYNALTVLPDNTFSGISRLERLNLSYNMIKTNFKELFYSLPCLHSLTLTATGLRVVPSLRLANLTELDLSGNYIASYRESDVRRLVNVRMLAIAKNRFSSLQPAMWTALPRLTVLDVSHNPIVRISRSSFDGLSRLLRLRMTKMHHLEAIEPRAFRALTSLRSLTIESPVLTSGNEGRLSDILGYAPGLESLELHIREHDLDSQLSALHAPKLRVLEVRGATVRNVAAHAFTALGRQHTLTLRLVGTGVSALPAGLLGPLASVPHLALDLSDNRLVALTPATIYPNNTDWNRLATKLLSGGLLLSGNPVECGCSVQWLGAWLRRWCAEVGGSGARARLAARRSECVGPPGAGAPVPLLTLQEGAARCGASALAGPAPPLAPPAYTLVLVQVLLLPVLPAI